MQTSAILNMQAGQQYADGNAEVSLDYLRRAVAEHGQFARGDGVGAIVAGNTAGLAILLYFHCVGLPKPTGLCGHPWMLLYEAHSAAAHALHADPSSPRLSLVLTLRFTLLFTLCSMQGVVLQRISE